MPLLLARITLYSLALYAIVLNVLVNFMHNSPTTLYSSAGAITILAQSAALLLSRMGFIEKLLRLTMRVRPLGTRERARIGPMVTDLERKTGLTGINVYLSPVKDINAGAIGRRTITINSGLLGKMNDEEVKGILAHEFSHLQHGEAQDLVTIAAISFLPRILINITLKVVSNLGAVNRKALYFPWQVRLFTIIAFLVVAIFAWGNLAIAVLAVSIDKKLLPYLTEHQSRKDEYQADAFAASVTSPLSILRALEIIEKEYGEVPQTFFERLLNSHPPLAYRIDRLHELSMRSNSSDLFGKARAA